MVSSLTGALNTANSSIRFNQNALSVISNNVANANTIGYTRQTIIAENQVIAGEGQGVSSGTIIRYADQTLQNSLDKQRANVEYNKAISEFFSAIEVQFGKLDVPGSSTSSNLDKQISDMFTQANNLVEDPLMSSNRVTFKNSTVQTTDRLNKLSLDLANNQAEIDGQISDNLTVVNTALKNISDLNYQIGQVERANGNSSDLKDLRQKEIDTLSQYFSVNVVDKEDGYVHVSLESGKVLVDSSYVQMTRTAGTPFGGVGFNRILQGGKISNTTQVLNAEDVSSGEIGALIRLRDDDIPDLIAQLDTFAVALIDEFNNIHAQGSPVPPPATLSGVTQPNGGATLLTDIGLQSGTDFDISVVDSTGAVVGTTASVPYTGSLNAFTTPDITTGTFDPEAYLTANGATSTIEGTASIEYMGPAMPGVYRMTDPSGSLHFATLDPAVYPVGAAPAALDFGNGIVLNVDAASAEPAAGNLGTVNLQLDGGPIRIETGDTLDDLNAKINANPALAGNMTAAIVDGALVLQATNNTHGIVVGNDPTGSTFNNLGFNRYFEGTSASTIQVSSSITGDLNNIATARMSSDGKLTFTNNENAVALANLQNQTFAFAESGGLNAQNSTLTEYFVSITSSFASEVNANTQSQTFNETLFDDFSARVQSISGVNTDEEFSNMIVYQRSFEASSRIIKTIDEMMEMLINMI
ncbi:MAG: flagellar hook-associated protein FlgK [Proteobacteria bacterium]|nr:flagellar hook-associated protein FlgK [Pseudomonadota bacterium]